jgi:hypothetical protein
MLPPRIEGRKSWPFFVMTASHMLTKEEAA